MIIKYCLVKFSQAVEYKRCFRFEASVRNFNNYKFNKFLQINYYQQCFYFLVLKNRIFITNVANYMILIVLRKTLVKNRF